MTPETSKRLILASASPRRKEILKKLGLKFETIPSKVDETIEENIPPDEAVRLLSLRKARDVANKLNTPAIVIGSDTTVVVDAVSLGKPVDYDDAYSMLKQLNNRSHRVITGLTIIDTSDGKTLTDSVSSEVYFKNLSENDIEHYIKTGEPMDKAGAYAIQGMASTFITHINGCYNNIVGLPVFKLSEMLKLFQIDILAINTAKDRL